MKLITFVAILETALAVDTSFNCPFPSIGACCEAYDPGDKLGYRCSFLPIFLQLSINFFSVLDSFSRILALIIEKKAKKLSVPYSEALPRGYVTTLLTYFLSVALFLL
jgi:hypothetical protein